MQLLVSPRDLTELKNALSADIIDIKNPREGSLGANFPWIIRTAKEMTVKPLSAAIGDYDFMPGNASLAAYGAATAGADFVKVGIKFDGVERVREFVRAVVRGVKEEYPEKFVVIAGYSDYLRMNSISPLEIPEIAAEEDADVAMIDTGIKDGRSTFDFMDEKALNAFVDTCRELGLRTAIAGSLGFAHLGVLKRIGADIVGVRGMVCEGGRQGMIDPELVERAVRMVR